jgi:hypothetical protein
MYELETLVVDWEGYFVFIIGNPRRLLYFTKDLSRGGAADQIVKFVPVCFWQVGVVKAVYKHIVDLA